MSLTCVCNAVGNDLSKMPLKNIIQMELSNANSVSTNRNVGFAGVSHGSAVIFINFL